MEIQQAKALALYQHLNNSNYGVSDNDYEIVY